MHYADIKKADIANGLGVRVSVFVSGCTHHCKNCFNSEAWDFNYGNEFTENEINRVIKELDHSYVSGLSVLGGEPLEHVNQQGLLPLLKRVKEKELTENYNINNLFKKIENNENKTEVSLIEYKKQNFIQKIISKIKSLFRRKN